MNNKKIVKVITMLLIMVTVLSLTIMLSACRFSLGKGDLITYDNVTYMDGDIDITPEIVIAPNNYTPKKDGHTFVSWALDSNGNGTFDMSAYNGEDVVLYAVWTVNEYRVKFVDHDGSVIKVDGADEQLVKYNTSAKNPDEPTRYGYTFTGWDKDYTSITEDTLITATYERTLAKVQLNCDSKVLIEKNDLYVGDSLEGFFATCSSALKEYTSNGLSIVGWFEDAELTHPIDVETAVAGDVTDVYPCFNVISNSTLELQSDSSNDTYAYSEDLSVGVSLSYTAYKRIGYSVVWFLDDQLMEGKDTQKIEINGLSQGRHTVKAVLTSTYNNTTVEDEKSLELLISIGTIKLKADDITIKYGDALPAFTYSVIEGDSIDLGSINYTTDYKQGKKIGDYSISIDKFKNDLYELIFVDGTLTVEAKPVTVTANSISLTYGDSLPKVFAYTVNGRVSDDDAFGTAVASCIYGAGSNVGDYDIEISGLENPNYKITQYIKGILKVSPKELDYNVEAKNIFFGEEAVFSYKIVKGALLDNDSLGTPVYETEYTKGSDIKDDYTVTLRGLSNPNYTFPAQKTTYFKVSPLSVAVNWTVKDSYEYNGLDQLSEIKASFYDINNNIVSLSIEASLSNVDSVFKNVGNYVLTAVNENKNYNLTSYKLNRTITPKKATITIESASTEYGSEAPSYSASESGLCLNDTLDYDIVCAYEIGSDKGEYYIDAVGAFNPNYDVTVVKGTLSVSSKSVYVEWLGDNDYTYNGLDMRDYVTATIEGYDGTISLTRVFTLDGVVSNFKNAGTYLVTVTLDNDNYTINDIERTLYILKKDLTVTAQDVSIVFGSNAPVFSSKFDGFVNGENESSLNGTLSHTCNYRLGYNVSEYSIRPYGLSSDNYEIEYVNGNLTVTPLEVAVKWNIASSYTYNGKSQKSAVTAEFKQYNNIYKNVNLSFDGDFIHVGEYNVEASLNNDNYTLTDTSRTISILPKALEIKAKNIDIVYGSPILSSQLGYTNTALASGDSISSVDYDSSAYSVGSNVGSYALKVSNAVVKNSSDYDITYVDGTVTVGKLSRNVNWNIGSYTYNGSSQSVGATYSTYDGNVVDLDVSYVSVSDRNNTSFKNAGKYTVTASASSTDASASNYDFNITSKTAEISPKSITVSVNALAVSYGDGANFTYSAPELIEGDELSDIVYECSYAIGSDIGTYPISITNIVNDNYSISTRGAILTVNAKNVDLDWTIESSYVYNGNSRKNDIVAKFVDIRNVSQNVTLTFSGDLKHVGNYSVVASYNDNYSFNNAQKDISITRKPITVTVNNSSVVYGNNASFSYSAPELITGDVLSNVTYAHDYSVGSNVGDYNVSISKIENSDYEITKVSGTLTVTQRPIEIVWESALSYTYTGNNQIGTVKCYYVDIDNNNVSLLENIELKNAGNYTLTAKALSDNNYKLSDTAQTQHTLSIAKKDASVTIGTKSVEYGWNDRDYSDITTVNGAIDGENIGAATSTYVFGSPVNTYTVSFAANEVGDTNYNISVREGSLKVAPRTINSGIVWSGDSGLIYNGLSQKETVGATFTDIHGVSQSLSLSYAFNNTSTSKSRRNAVNDGSDFVNAGTYTVTLSYDGNYTFTVETRKEIKIEPKKVTVTVTVPQSVTYGDSLSLTAENSVYDWVYDGDVTKIGNIQYTYDGDASYNASTSAGTDVVIVAGGYSNSNYTFEYKYKHEGGSESKDTITISVTKRTASVVWTLGTYTYNGSDQKSGTTATFKDVNGNDVSMTVVYPNSFKDAGEYELTATNTNANYSYTNTAINAEIAKKSLTVNVYDKETTYGESAPAFQFYAPGIIAGDVIGTYSYTTDYTVGSDVKEGGYKIYMHFSSVNPNYTLSNIKNNGDITSTATLTVNPRPVTVKVNNEGITFGDSIPTYTADVTKGSLYNKQTIADLGKFVCDYTDDKTNGNSWAGKYTISFNKTNANYDVTVRTGTLTVSKLSTDVVWAGLKDSDNKNHVYNGSVQQVITAKILGNVSLRISYQGINVSTNTVFQNADIYTLTASLDSTATDYNFYNTNYELLGIESMSTIDPKPVTITVANAEGVYGYDITIGLSVNGVVDGENINAIVNFTYKPYSTNVGTYSNIGAKYDSNSNYSVNVNEGSLTVTQQPVAVVWTLASYTYNGSDQKSGTTATYTPHNKTAVSMTVNYPDSFKNAGTYALTATHSDTNYLFYNEDEEPNTASVTVTKDATIEKKALSVSIVNSSTTYGEAMVLAHDGLEGDTINISFEGYTVGNPVGDHTITFKSVSNNNYELATTSATLTVNQRPVTVEVGNNNITFGDAVPTYTANIVSGSLYGSDTISSLGSCYSDYVQYITDKTNENSWAKKYTISFNKTNANYDVTVRTGTLTVGKKPVSVDWDGLKDSNDKNHVYNGSVQQVITANILGNVSLHISYEGKVSTNTVFQNADTYTLTASLDSTATDYNFYNTNYSLNTSTTTEYATIDCKTVTVTVTVPQSVTYGDSLSLTAEDSVYDWVYSGDVTKIGDIQYTYDGASYNASTSAGTDVVIVAGGYSNSNYKFEYKYKYLNGAGIFDSISTTVVSRKVTVTMPSYTVTFGAHKPDVHNATIGNVYNNEFVGTVTGSTEYDIGKPVTADGYVITGSINITNSNYELDKIVNGKITVNKKSTSITWSGLFNNDKTIKTFTYNENNTITASYLAYDETTSIPMTVSYLGTSEFIKDQTTFKNAGTYKLTASTMTEVESNNYDFSGATLSVSGVVIQPKTVSVTWSGLGSFTYNGQTQDAGITVSVSTDESATLAISYLGTSESNKDNHVFLNAGNYTLTASWGSASATVKNNYTLDDTTTTKENITISPAPITVSISDPGLCYGDASLGNESLSTKTSAKLSDDTILFESGATLLSVGEFSLKDYTQGISAGSSYTVSYTLKDTNYTLSTEVSLQCTVNQRAITVTVNPKDTTYGDSAPAFDGSAITYNGESLTDIGQFTTNYSVGNDKGNYTITYKLKDNSNYKLVNADNVIINEVTGKLTVNPRAITVTVNPKETTYGESAPEFNGSANNIYDNQSLDFIGEFSTDYSVGNDKGNYTITYKLTNSNYTLTSVTSATLTVKPAVRQLTWSNNTGLEYNGTPQNVIATFTDVSENEQSANITYVKVTESTAKSRRNTVSSESTVEFKNAGNYKATASYPNYVFYVGTLTEENTSSDEVYIEVTIAPKNVYITIDDANATYGTAYTLKNIVKNIDGIVEGESIGDTNFVTVDIDYSQSTNKGEYTIKYSFKDDPNYNFIAKDSNGETVTIKDGDNREIERKLIVAPKEVEVHWTIGTYTYTGKDQEVTAYYLDINNKQVDMVVTYKTDDKEVDFVNAGDYNLTATHSDTNYIFYNKDAGSDKASRTVTNEAIINPKDVTITIDDATVTYGDLFNLNSVIHPISGLVKESDIEPEYSLFTRDTSGSSVKAFDYVSGTTGAGTYNIDVKPINNPNYTVTVNKGTLTVNRRDAIIAVINASTTYGEESVTNQGDITYTNVLDSDKASLNVSYTFSYTKGNSVGYYPITVNTSNDNYNITVKNDNPTDNQYKLGVNPKEVSVEWPTTSFTYTGEKQSVTAQYKNINNTMVDMDVTFSGKSSVFKDAGSYTVTAKAKTADELNNYTFTDANTDKEISPAPITISFKDNLSVVYGSDFEFVSNADITLNGITVKDGALYGSDKITSVGAFSGYTKGNSVKTGGYPITYDLNSGITNYTVPVTNGTLTVEKFKVTSITWSGLYNADNTIKSFIYNATNQIAGTDANPGIKAYYSDCNGDLIEMTVKAYQESTEATFQNAGTYTICATATDSLASNYDFSDVNAKLSVESVTIGKKDATITISNAYVTKGEDLPEEFSFKTDVYECDSNVVTSDIIRNAIIDSIKYSSTTAPGTYSFTIEVANYSFNTCYLEVRGNIALTWSTPWDNKIDNISWTYGKQTISTGAITATYEYNSQPYSAVVTVKQGDNTINEIKNAGSYTVIASVNNSHTDLGIGFTNSSFTITVNKYKVTSITWSGIEGVTYTYNGSDQKGAITASYLAYDETTSIPMTVSYLGTSEFIKDQTTFKNAGTYKLTASTKTEVESNNYDFSDVTLTNSVIMSPKQITVTIGTPTAKAYGDAALTKEELKNLTSINDTSGTVLADLYGSGATNIGTTTCTYVQGSSVGTYDIVFTFNGNSNYSVTNATKLENGIYVVKGDLTVNPLETGVEWTTSFIYNGSTQQVTAQYTAYNGDKVEMNILSYLGISTSNDGDTSFKNAGTYTVTAKAKTADELKNYTFTGANENNEVTKSITISPAPITVSISDPGLCYGDASLGNESLFTKTSAELSNDTKLFEGATLLSIGELTLKDYTQGNSAGSEYIITYKLKANSNYKLVDSNKNELTEVARTFKVNQRAITVTVNPKDTTYGDSAPAFDGSAITYNGESLTDIGQFTTDYNVGDSVGSNYTITYTLNANSNYTLSSVTTATLTVKQRTLSITTTASELTVEFGVTPSYSYGYDGLFSEDDIKDNISVIVSAYSGVEGNKVLFEAGNAITGKVGSYTIFASDVTITRGAKSVKDNYAISYVTKTLTVNPRAISISIADCSVQYGSPIPDYSDYTTVDSGTFYPTTWNIDNIGEFTCDYQQGTPVTTTTALEIGFTCKNDNYSVTVTCKGNLTVTSRKGTVAINWTLDSKPLSSATYTYNGSDYTSTLKSLIKASYIDYNDASVEMNVVYHDVEIKNKGTYTLSAIANTENEISGYTFADTKFTVTISPALITISFKDNLSVEYDSAFDFVSKVVITLNDNAVSNGKLCGDDTITSIGSFSGYDKGYDVKDGGYTITYNLKDDITNYTVTVTNGTLTVTAKPVEVVWTIGTYTYTGEKQSVTAQYENINNTMVDMDVTFSGKSSIFKDAGTYQLTASAKTSDSLASNYAFTNASKNDVEIKKAQATITIDNAPVTYGDAFDITSIVKSVQLVNDETLSGVTLKLYNEGTEFTYAKDTSAGSYTIKYTFADNSNYSFTAKDSYDNAVDVDLNGTTREITRTLTVSPKSVTLTWKTDYTYNGTVQTPTATFTDALNAENSLPATVTADREFKNAGIYTLTASKDDNYTFTNGSQNVELMPAPITISFNNNLSVEYGSDFDFVSNAVITLNGETVDNGALYGDDTITSVGSFSGYDTKKTPGNYTITYKLNSNSNYKLVNAEGIEVDKAEAKLTVNKQQLAVTWTVDGESVNSVVYNGSDQSGKIKALISIGANTYELDVALDGASAFVNVGTYTFKADFTTAQKGLYYDDNYALSNPTFSVEITKFVITSIDWSGLDEAYTYTGSDLGGSIEATHANAAGGTSSAIELTLSFVGKSESNSGQTSFMNAGDYTITATAKDTANYDFSRVSSDAFSRTKSINKATYKADQVPAVSTITGTYDPNKKLSSYNFADYLSKEDVAKAEYFSWVDSTIVPTVNQKTYLAEYNADSNNYNDCEVTITIDLAKATYKDDQVPVVSTITGTYDPNKKLSSYNFADYLSEENAEKAKYFSWSNEEIVPTVNQKTYSATYNADSNNYNDCDVPITIDLAKATYKADQVPAVSTITGTYDPNKKLSSYKFADYLSKEDVAKAKYFSWSNEEIVPTVNQKTYSATYNADSNNYNDCEVTITIDLAKATYKADQVPAVSTITGTYDPNKKLSSYNFADYLSEENAEKAKYFSWSNEEIVPTVNQKTYSAKYNANSENYEPFEVTVTINLAKATYKADQVPAVSTITGTYDPNKKLSSYNFADYLSEENAEKAKYFSWSNEEIVPTVNQKTYSATYNADSDNYNDFNIDITINIAPIQLSFSIIDKTVGYGETVNNVDLITPSDLGVTLLSVGTFTSDYSTDSTPGTKHTVTYTLNNSNYILVDSNNNEVSKVTGTITVEKFKVTSITWKYWDAKAKTWEELTDSNKDKAFTYNGSNQIEFIKATYGKDGELTITCLGPDSISDRTEFKNAGTYTVTATKPDSSALYDFSGLTNLTIDVTMNKATYDNSNGKYNLTLLDENGKNFTYDPNKKLSDYTLDDNYWWKNDTLTPTYSKTTDSNEVLSAGTNTLENRIAYNADPDNYEYKEVTLTITIVKKEVTVAWTYNGEAWTDDTMTVEFSKTNFANNITATYVDSDNNNIVMQLSYKNGSTDSADLYNAGTYSIKATPVAKTQADNVAIDFDKNYNFTGATKALIINKATVTLEQTIFEADYTGNLIAFTPTVLFNDKEVDSGNYTLYYVPTYTISGGSKTYSGFTVDYSLTQSVANGCVHNNDSSIGTNSIGFTDGGTWKPTVFLSSQNYEMAKTEITIKINSVYIGLSYSFTYKYWKYTRQYKETTSNTESRISGYMMYYNIDDLLSYSGDLSSYTTIDTSKDTDIKNQLIEWTKEMLLSTMPNTSSAQENKLSYYDGGSITITSYQLINKIIVANNTRLNQDNYVKSGVTLIVPYDYSLSESNTATVERVISGTGAFSTLTLSQNTTLTVTDGGTLNVAGRQCFNQPYAGRICGKYGEMVLESDAYVTVEGSLYSFGYVSGAGSIDVYGNAYEPIQIQDWCGGTIAYSVYEEYFPFSQFIVANIEASMKVYYGANLYVHYYIIANSTNFTGEFVFIGKDGLFEFTTDNTSKTDYIKKSVDCSKGKITIESHCNATTNNLEISIRVGAITVTMDTANKEIPICGFYDIICAEGNTIINSKFKFLPGSKFKINKGATCTVESSGGIIGVNELEKIYTGKYNWYYGTNNSNWSANYNTRLKSVYTYNTPAELTINGTITVAGSFGGNVITSVSGAIMDLREATLNSSIYAYCELGEEKNYAVIKKRSCTPKTYSYYVKNNDEVLSEKAKYESDGKKFNITTTSTT